MSHILGLNPDKKIEKNEDEFDFKDKCTEIYIHRPAASDAIAFIRMIAYNQGKFLLGHLSDDIIGLIQDSV